MRVVLTTIGGSWLEDWDCKTERSALAIFKVKYGRGRPVEETEAPSQYSRWWSYDNVSCGVLREQPTSVGHITPINRVYHGIEYMFEQRAVKSLKQLDEFVSDPSYADRVRKFMRDFGSAVGMGK